MDIKFNNQEWQVGDIVAASKSQPLGLIIKNSVGDYCVTRINSPLKSDNFTAQEDKIINCESYDSMACLRDEMEPQGYHVVHATLNIDVRPSI